MSLRIGTSGWIYDDWNDAFYPEGLRGTDLFKYYAAQFSTVEINATFYRLPSEKMVKGWHDRAPNGFLFAVKGSRFITHIKKLNNLEDAVERFIERVKPLGKTLGPLLWQLPPNLHKDLDRLKEFVKHLSPKFSHAIEFRDSSWYDGEVEKVLKKRSIAQVWVSSKAMPDDAPYTADFVYIRFHGLEGGAHHDYTKKELKPWAERIRKARLGRKDVFAYFNNDGSARAPKNAQALIGMLD